MSRAWRGRGLAPVGPAQAPSPSVQASPAGVPADPSHAELTILKALMANPITAPFRIVTSTRNGRVVLSGRVGTKAVHDAAVQTGIATGYPIQDDLVIDTAEVYRAAALAASPGWGPSHAWDIPPLGAGTVPFVYPPPCSAGSTTPSSASNRRWSHILRGLRGGRSITLEKMEKELRRMFPKKGKSCKLCDTFDLDQESIRRLG